MPTKNSALGGFFLSIVSALSATSAQALELKDLIGTWKLVSSTRRVLESGQITDTYGPHPTGWVTFGRDNRMMVLIVGNVRPKPPTVAAITDADRASLFKTMVAYSGTFSLTGESVTFNVDASWNEVWTGTRVIRDVAMDGPTLILTTRPAPFSVDGRISVVTLKWERAS